MEPQFDLSHLIHPISTEEFFSEYWEKKPLHIRRNDPQFFSSLLTLDDIDRVITTLGLHHPRIELTNARQQIQVSEYTFPSGMIDVTRLYQHFAEGATIILPQLDWTISSLAHLCRAMEREINSRFQTNIYLTPGGESQGFKTHYDSHDVFVLQVSGSKHWRVYDTPVELPYRGQAFDPKTVKPNEVTMEIDILPGDVFYLPRGVMHDAHTLEGGSLHATLGVLFTSWTDLLVEALAQVGLRDPMFRKGLPPGFAKENFDRTQAKKVFHELLNRLVNVADFDQSLDHFVSDIITTRHPLLDGQMSQIMKLDSLTTESLVGVRPHLFSRIHKDSEHVWLDCHGREVRLPLHAEIPLRYAVTSPHFRVGDLPGELDDSGKIVLIRKLMLEGMVRFIDG